MGVGWCHFGKKPASLSLSLPPFHSPARVAPLVHRFADVGRHLQPQPRPRDGDAGAGEAVGGGASGRCGRRGGEGPGGNKHGDVQRHHRRPHDQLVDDGEAGGFAVDILAFVARKGREGREGWCGRALERKKPQRVFTLPLSPTSLTGTSPAAGLSPAGSPPSTRRARQTRPARSARGGSPRAPPGRGRRRRLAGCRRGRSLVVCVCVRKTGGLDFFARRALFSPCDVGMWAPCFPFSLSRSLPCALLALPPPKTSSLTHRDEPHGAHKA